MVLRASLWVIALALAWPLNAHATTWGDDEARDPISGEMVKVKSINSYGHYIYRWPSKYDLVYWPLTDENSIRLNSKNGYCAFGPDFEQISDAEKARVKTFLLEEYVDVKLDSHLQKMAWLEQVYRARGATDVFWNAFYRLSAYLHRHNKVKSAEFRKKATALITKELESQEGYALARSYYLLGFYSYLEGDKKSADTFFEKVRSLSWPDDQEAKKYLLNIIEEVTSGRFQDSYFRKAGH